MSLLVVRLGEGEESFTLILPGMVRRKLVGVAVELDSLGLFDSGVDAFLVIQGDGRFAFAEDAVRQDSPLVEQGHRAVEGLADGDLGTP